MKKKVTAVCATVALAAVAMGGATLAYFTDQDEAENVFSIGNLDIELTEDCKVNGVICPTNLDTGKTEFNNLMPTDVITKEPVVTNEGDQPAYVRVAVTMNNTVAINEAIDEVYEAQDKTEVEIQAIKDIVFNGWGLNHSHEGTDDNGRRMTMNQRPGDAKVIHIDSAFLMSGGDYQFNRANTFQSNVEKEDCANAAVYQNDGVVDGYNGQSISDCYYFDALDRDARVYVFYLKLAPGESYTLFQGLNVPAQFTGEQMAMFDGLEIGIYADAIQTAGFDTPEAAFNALETEHALGWWK